MRIALATASALACACSGNGGGSGSGVRANGAGGVAGGATAGARATSGAPAAGAAGTGGSVRDAQRPLDYVRAEPFGKLVLEVDSVPGFEPRASVEALIMDRLGQLLDKPSGVETVQDEALAGRDTWSFTALQELAEATFDDAPGEGAIAMHAMFVDGTYSGPELKGTVFGLAWANREIAIFKETIEKACRGGTLGLVGPLEEQACAEAERAIWLHELGHVIGLVNDGLPMLEPHEDADHPAHDASDKCLLYWAYDGQGLLDLIVSTLAGGGEPKFDFDAKCLADVEAAK